MVRLRFTSCTNCKTSLLVNWAVSHSNKAWGTNTLIRQHNQVFCHRSFSGGCVGEKKTSKLARFYKKSAVHNEHHQCSPFYFFVLNNRIRSAWKLKGISCFHLKLKWIGIWKITFTKWSLMLLKPALSRRRDPTYIITAITTTTCSSTSERVRDGVGGKCSPSVFFFF